MSYSNGASTHRSGPATRHLNPGGTPLVSIFPAFASGLLMPHLVQQPLANASEHSAVQKDSERPR
jgi:hypothetical protein